MKIAQIPKFDYTPGQLQYFQFIRGGIGAGYHQEPKFYQLPDGGLMLYWSAYDFDETSNDLVKLYSISKDGGLTWSDPEIFMADYLGGVPYFVLFQHIKGTQNTLMFYTKTHHDPMEVDPERQIQTSHGDCFKSKTRVFLKRSNDGGRSFDHGHELDCKQIAGNKQLAGVVFYGAIDDVLQLESGRVVVAYNFLDPELCDIKKGVQHYTLVCMYSDDSGQTWQRSTEIMAKTPRGAMECQIVETEPDRLLCLFRTQGGYLYQSVSTDGGKTWSQSEPTVLQSPESMVRMIKLKSGNILVVWNNVFSKTQQPRHPLSAVLSKDGGRTWGEPKLIADETGGNQLSNHGMIQLDDGRILLGISHYRDVRPMTSDLDLAIFDELWLLDGYELPLNWKFKTDPQDIGEKEKWYQAKPDSSWSDIQTDNAWTNQGYKYHGTAWYSVEFEGPELSEDMKHLLRFGAVDGLCWIWLDGELIGTQLESPDTMWDRLFTIDITDKIKAGKEHKLVVKVIKESNAAGIWKPVDVVEMNKN